MLESVTLDGTAKRAQLDGYTAAGKTGTAQKIDPRTHAYSKTKYVASFVGFAPATDPSVVIAVVVDEPSGAYHGGDVAAPVFREIAERVLPLMNVAPDARV
ncbi:MAG: penicillin-binding transpeptidase domain-containing protein [Pyrinomonadaceae bacterium]